MYTIIYCKKINLAHRTEQRAFTQIFTQLLYLWLTYKPNFLSIKHVQSLLTTFDVKAMYTHQAQLKVFYVIFKVPPHMWTENAAQRGCWESLAENQLIALVWLVSAMFNVTLRGYFLYKAWVNDNYTGLKS